MVYLMPLVEAKTYDRRSHPLLHFFNSSDPTVFKFMHVDGDFNQTSSMCPFEPASEAAKAVRSSKPLILQVPREHAIFFQAKGKGVVEQHRAIQINL